MANSGNLQATDPAEGPDFLAAWRRNPFFILGLEPSATPAEIERAGQKLLGLLTVGSASAAQCHTPLGPASRDADAVRNALASLRDPAQRLLYRLWADVAPVCPASVQSADEQTPSGPENSDPLHLRLLGWNWGR